MQTLTCKACERKSGLPICFLFHTAIATDSQFVPPGASALQSDTTSVSRIGLPGLAHARYVLRSLRPLTYLHVWHEKPPPHCIARAKALNERRSANGQPVDAQEAHWEVLRVLPGGALAPDNHPFFEQGEPFTCSQDGGSHIFTAITYRLDQAHEAGTIKVAVSANLWDAKLRAKNQSDAKAMQSIDVPMALAGGAWPAFMRPSAEWLTQHVADLAVPHLNHGVHQGPSSPLAQQVRGRAEELLKRMADISASHPKTKDKGFFFALPDPVGTASALSDITVARHQQGLLYAQSQQHGLKAASRIQMLFDTAFNAEVQKAQEQRQTSPLTTADLRDAQGRPAFSPSNMGIGQRCAESTLWVKVGEMGYQGFLNERDIHKNLPKTAQFLPYERDLARGGLVIAPIKDLAAMRSKISTRKLERLHKAADMQAFLKDFEQRCKQFETQVAQHDQDRATLLKWPMLAHTFACHFNPADPNRKGPHPNHPAQRTHLPGEVYMAECSRALIGAGQYSAAFLKLTQELMAADITADGGWALRGMVGNQQALFAPLRNGLEQAVFWLTAEDNKLDKAYDTFKALITDDFSAGWMKAKFGWLNPTGIGLSYGLYGFFAGAAGQMLATQLALKAQALAKAAAPGANAALQAAAGKTQAAMQAAIQRTDQALAVLDSAEGKLAAKFQTWAEWATKPLDALLHSQPPLTPVRLRAWVTLAEFLEAVDRLEVKRTGSFNRATRDLIAQVRQLASKTPLAPIELDFLSDNLAVREMRSTADLVQRASGVRAPVYSDAGKFIELRNADTGKLLDAYMQAHRFDGLKQTLMTTLTATLPDAAAVALLQVPKGAARLAQGGAVAATGAGAAVAKGAAKVAPHVAGASMAIAKQGNLSIFGALLQWRLHEANEAKLAKLRERLLIVPNLSPEQRQAIQDAIDLTELGFWDNKAGITGGVAELAAIGLSQIVQNTGGKVQSAFKWTAGSGAAIAAFAGAAGSFLNAAQNYKKAAGKYQENDLNLFGGYGFVSLSYFLAGASLGISGGQILFQLVAKRTLVEASILTGQAAAARAAGARVTVMFVLRGLSATGWGLVFTVIAFGVEGVVAYYDRTALEAWVENCYFGTEPKWRSPSNLQIDAKAEDAAFEDAIRKATAEAATHDKTEALPAGLPSAA